MNWDRVNSWTNTLYATIQSLTISKNAHFGDLSEIGASILGAGLWISPACSYSSPLMTHGFGKHSVTFRRDPNKHFAEIAQNLIKMLVQDLQVIFDDMMRLSLEEHGVLVPNYPQSKVERLGKFLDPKYDWAREGCLELIAARNVLCHSAGRWNEQSIKLVEKFVAPLPKEGDALMIGTPMLFHYRKAMRTFLNETSKRPPTRKQLAAKKSAQIRRSRSSGGNRKASQAT